MPSDASVLMVMGVIVRMMPVPEPVPMLVPVAMTMTVSAGGIGAAFRIERALDMAHRSTKAKGHGLDHVIAPNQDRATIEHCRQVAVAEMPRKADRMGRIGGCELCQRLSGCLDQHLAPIFENQRCTIPDHFGFGEVEQEGQAILACHGHAPAVARVMIEHDNVSRRAMEVAMNAGGAQHYREPSGRGDILSFQNMK